MANIIYNEAKQLISTALLDLSTADLYIMLTNGYTPLIENDEFVSDISSYETSGTGYYRQALTTVTLTRDTVNNRMTLTAANVTWASANFISSGAVIYVNNGSDPVNTLVTFLDFGTSKSSANTPFEIQWSVEGILQLR
jgi:hypothetical protein